VAQYDAGMGAALGAGQAAVQRIQRGSRHTLVPRRAARQECGQPARAGRLLRPHGERQDVVRIVQQIFAGVIQHFDVAAQFHEWFSLSPGARGAACRAVCL